MLMARDGARDEAQKLHRKWMKHQAFMAELARNKEWLAKIEQEGRELIQEQPELQSVVQQKLEEMRECWTHLESTTKAKARQLFETQNHRTPGVDPPPKTLSDLDQQLSLLQEQPPTGASAGAGVLGATAAGAGLGTGATSTLGAFSSSQPTLLQPRPSFSQQLQRIQTMESQLYRGVGLSSLGGSLLDTGLGAAGSGMVSPGAISCSPGGMGGGTELQTGMLMGMAGMGGMGGMGGGFGMEGDERPAETRICRLIEPLRERRRLLLASKEMHQVSQDLEDEIVWIQERLPLASSKEYGNNLQSVQQLMKTNEVLQVELQSRRERLEEVLERAGAVAALHTPESELVREGAEHARQLWEVLLVEAERRTVMLDTVFHAQQYYSQAAKAESWLSGQKLQVINEEKGADEPSTLKLLKEQLSLEQSVQNYAQTVSMLSQQCRRMLELGHPDSEQITKQQAHIDRLYVSLRELVEQRKTKLEQQYWLYQLRREVESLEKWISQREAVASSTEMGQDLEHVTTLQEKFTKFTTETRAAGQRQMESVNKMVNEMIDCGHADAATIAEWKDGLNESWADLQELMETRSQMLAASHQLHKFFTDCQEVLVQIEGKMRQLPEVRSCQVSTANPGTLQRLLHSFEHALQTLVTQVRQLQENATQLRAIYAGEKADAILAREQEVMQAWRELLVSCEGSRVQVTTVTDKVQFFALVRELSMWTDGIMGQIGPSPDSARDVTGVENMMSQHQGLKAKMEAKSKMFNQCVEMGKMLLAARNPASDEVREKLDHILAKQKDLNTRWDQHWERLQHTQQRLQDSQRLQAERAWLTSKEPMISPASPRESLGGAGEGGGADEVEQLIRRHEAFRKAAATWKEHFSSLRQAEKLKEEKSRHSTSSSLLNRQMFPLSCLMPSSSSSSSSSTPFRQSLQDQLDIKSGQDVPQLAAHSLAQRLGAYNTVMNGSSYQGLAQQAGVGMMDNPGYHGLAQQAGQHLKADCMQPKLNHIHKAVPALLEAHQAQQQQQGHPMGEIHPGIGIDHGLELLHGRLQRDPRGSRSDPQMDHLRREREYRLGRQTSSEQEIQARLNELPMIVRQERYRRRLERQSSSEQEQASGKPSDQESGREPSDKRPGDKRSTMAEIVEQVQEREAAHARGEVYRPPSVLSAPCGRLDRPRARDRPKPRRRPRPKEPEETTRRSRSAPAQSALAVPTIPCHTVQQEGFLYRKHEPEGKEKSPNSKSWVNLYCVLVKGEIGFYKDPRHTNTPYNDEPLLNLSGSLCDSTNGYKKKKNAFILKVPNSDDYIFLAKDEEDFKKWVASINASLKEHEDIIKWEKPTTSSTDPDRSEQREGSEGIDRSEGADRSEKADGSGRSERAEGSEKADGSEKVDMSDRLEGRERGSSTSGRSK